MQRRLCLNKEDQPYKITDLKEKLRTHMESTRSMEFLYLQHSVSIWSWHNRVCASGPRTLYPEISQVKPWIQEYFNLYKQKTWVKFYGLRLEYRDLKFLLEIASWSPAQNWYVGRQLTESMDIWPEFLCWFCWFRKPKTRKIAEVRWPVWSWDLSEELLHSLYSCGLMQKVT